MTWTRYSLALLLGSILTADAQAQFFPLPPAEIGVPVLVPNGISFQYKSRRWRVDGFIGTGGYSPGVIPLAPNGFGPIIASPPWYYYASPYCARPFGMADNRVTVQVINPPGLGQTFRRPGPFAGDVDLSGIDLDVEPASKIWDNVPGAGKVRVAEHRVPKKVEQAKIPPEDRVPPAKPPKLPDPPAPDQPKVEPVPEWKRQIDNGIAAFRNEDYGIAILRFRQLADADPAWPRALFLQAQAFLAVGRYRDAVQAIEKGLALRRDWPTSGFRPKTELYGNDVERLQKHVDRLVQAQRQEPKNPDHLFLLGYVAWFEGQEELAVDYFRQARALAANPQWSELFLQVAAAKADGK